MTRLFCLLAASALLLGSCKTDTRPDPVPAIQGSEYYPLATGDYMIYQVTETRQIGAGTSPVSETFQTREVVDSMFTDLAGEPFYRIFRSRRDLPTDNWAEDSVIVVKKTNRGLERQENNFRQIKMAYPVYLNREWNPNLNNPSDQERWRYTEVNTPYTLNRPTGDTLFQNTILVQQADEVNLVDSDLRWERYAHQVGLIESSKYTEFNIQDGSGGYELIQSFRREAKLLERGQQ